MRTFRSLLQVATAYFRQHTDLNSEGASQYHAVLQMQQAPGLELHRPTNLDADCLQSREDWFRVDKVRACQ